MYGLTPLIVQMYGLTLLTPFDRQIVDMESSDVFRLLTRRFRRGLVIFPTLWIVAIIWGGQSLVGSRNRSWAVAASFAALLFYLGFDHVRKEFVSAKKVSVNPRIVYWGHSANLRLPFSARSSKYFILHLRDGCQLEVNLPPTEMAKFIDWLKEQNPSVRLGPYDDAGPTPAPMHDKTA